MRVGIVGAGEIAGVQGPLIQKHGAEIVGVVDTHLAKAQELARGLGVGKAYADVPAMLREQEPDLVHVLVPPHHHAELSIMAMDHGCHVLVEKPMALTVGECERMIEASARNGVSLCVDHNPLFDDPFRRAIAMSSNGVIGDVVSVEAHEVYDVARAPAFTAADAERTHWAYATSGGPLQDLFPHPACLVLQFVPEVQEMQVMAINRGVFPADWNDELRVMVRSEKVLGYIHISASERPDACTFTIKGTRGSLHADSYNQILTFRAQSGLPRKIGRGLDGIKLARQNLTGTLSNVFRLAVGRLDKVNGIDSLIEAFYESVREGREPPVAGEDAMRTIDLMNRVWPATAVAK